MDFVEGLPKVKRKSLRIVVVDRLSKYTQFFPLAHSFAAMSLANVFFAEVFQLHGLPESIVLNQIKFSSVSFGRNYFVKMVLS